MTDSHKKKEKKEKRNKWKKDNFMSRVGTISGNSRSLPYTGPLRGRE
jgi:hypothetical protein